LLAKFCAPSTSIIAQCFLTAPHALQERFAKLKLKELEQRSPQPPDYFVLKRHLDFYADCQKFATVDIMKCPAADLEESIDKISGVVDNWPSSTKQQLLERRIQDVGVVHAKTTKEQLDDLFAAIMPWSTHEEDDGAFDPKRPTLLTLDGSHLEKANLFQGFLLQRALTPMLSLGPDYQESMVTWSHVALGHLKKPPQGLDDCYLEKLFEFRKVFLGVIGLLTPGSSSGVDEAYNLAKALPRRGRSPSAFDTAASILHGTAWWAGILADMKKHYDGTKEYMREYTGLAAKLSDQSKDLTLDELLHMATAFEKFSCQMRAGLVAEFRQLLITRVEAASKVVVDMCGRATEMAASEDSIALLQKHVALYRKCDSLIPYAELKAKDLISIAQGLSDKLAKQAKFEAFGQALSEITAQALADTSLTSVLEKLRGTMPQSASAPEGCEAVAGDAAVKAVCGYISDPARWGQCGEEQATFIQVVGALVEMAFVTTADDTKFTFQVLQQTKTLDNAMDDLQGIGSSAQEVAAKDSLLKATKTAINAQNVLCELLGPEAASNGDIVVARAAIVKAKKFTDEVGQIVLAAKAEELSTRVAKFKDVAQGCIGIDSGWKDTLGADDDYGKVEKKAKKTILKVDGVTLKAILDEMQVMKSSYEGLLELFSTTNQELVDQIAAHIKAGRSGIFEAKLILGFSTFAQDEVKLYKFATLMKKDRATELSEHAPPTAKATSPPMPGLSGASCAVKAKRFRPKCQHQVKSNRLSLAMRPRSSRAPARRCCCMGLSLRS